MKAAIGILMVFLGCCSNVVFLELIVSELPSSANIITFCQFLFISLEGLVFVSRFGTVSPKVPLKYYLLMVSMFFVVQVVNNQALNFNVSMPLHMIFRAGSLVANLILGIIILKKRYELSKYLSVALISIGIATCTISSATQVEAHPSHTGDVNYDLMMWIVGVVMLSFVLFMSAWMGIFQEQTYAKFGKHPSEALFYNHFLPLPLFLFLSSDIYKHIAIFNASAPTVVPLLGITAPKMWVYLTCNTLTQYVCIRAVFLLTTECPSLTVTLVVTLRKFLSLIFSIMYFKNPFTVYHWIGTVCVFIGTLLFTEVLSSLFFFLYSTFYSIYPSLLQMELTVQGAVSSCENIKVKNEER